MNSAKILVTLMAILVTLLELMYEGKNVSAFDTHPKTMLIFCVNFVICGMSFIAADGLVAPNIPNENDGAAIIMSKAVLFSGSLALIMLLLVIVPLLGWFILVFWIVYFVKVVFEGSLTALHLWLQYKILMAICILSRGIPYHRHGSIVTLQNRLPV